MRQAISWWRADVTGQYGLPAGAAPSPPPAFDRDAITGPVRYAEAGETGWRDWFAAHSVEHFEITYEDLVEDLDTAVRDIAGFLEVPCRPDSGLSARECAARPITTPNASCGCSAATLARSHLPGS